MGQDLQRRESQRTRRLVIVFATLALGGAIAIGAMVGSSPKGTAFAVGVGILGSLIASFYVVLVNVFVLGDDGVEASRLSEAVHALEQAVPILAQMSNHRVLAVQSKGRFSDADWIDLLEQADRELFIVGHALNKWCRDDMRDTFERTIERLTRNSGTVQLIMLPATGRVTTMLSGHRGKDYSRRIDETLDVLAAVSAALPAECRDKLDVRVLLDDGFPMPYMLAGNDTFLITAAYPLAADDSDAMLAVKVEARTPFAWALRNDLRKLAGERFSTPVDLRRHRVGSRSGAQAAPKT
jgi:hypothetical protein